MAKILIALGGNTGQPESAFDEALEILQTSGVDIGRISSRIRTRAMGGSAGGAFLNAVAAAECSLSPIDLLQLLHDVECQLGRERTVHWGPRPIDLDLLAFDDQIIESDEITVPHPGLWYRRFVVEPLAEIAPDWPHPTLQMTAATLLKRLQQRPLVIEAVLPNMTALPFLRQVVDHAGSGSVELRSARSESACAKDCCARFLETRAADSERRQPPLEREPVIRVPVKGDRLEDVRVWEETLTNFCTAAVSRTTG